ncbi:MAG: hypothetical protein V1731_01475 [Candidatus Aenigmatarchaeota archaeon]
MSKTCPNCNGKIELVQSTPTVILLCRDCGSFFDAALESVGDTRSGLDLQKLPTKPISFEQKPAPVEKQAEQVLENQPALEAPKQPEEVVQEREEEKSGGIMSVINRFQKTGIVCPQCKSDGMKQLVSKITGNAMYTCPKCGYTGKNYFQA